LWGVLIARAGKLVLGGTTLIAGGPSHCVTDCAGCGRQPAQPSRIRQQLWCGANATRSASSLGRRRRSVGILALVPSSLGQPRCFGGLVALVASLLWRRCIRNPFRGQALPAPRGSQTASSVHPRSANSPARSFASSAGKNSSSCGGGTVVPLIMACAWPR